MAVANRAPGDYHLDGLTTLARGERQFVAHHCAAIGRITNLCRGWSTRDRKHRAHNANSFRAHPLSPLPCSCPQFTTGISPAVATPYLDTAYCSEIGERLK